MLPKDATGKSKYFEGTPIPTSIGVVMLMAFWVNKGMFLENLPLGIVGEGLCEFHPAVLLFAVHGSLMISRSIHIPKP